MAKHKVITTEAEIDQAIQEAKKLKDEPRVVGVEYVPGTKLDLLILRLNDGRRQVIPRENLEGLQDAPSEQIGRVEILGNGTGLHWPDLNVDFYVPNLLMHIYGTRRWMAQIGRSGGSVKSVAKRKASRTNGLKGGRPRQKEQRLSR
ncbi:MAG TPA: DUF2442 domain-containing protein [Acidobacteriaceae bacterium]|jgi:hypothetical protein|nr:DUF2442 domain-containing protein [Acidobacteriaceae bacterium]